MKFTGFKVAATLLRVAALAGAAMLVSTASAQTLCKGRGFIDSVYQTGLGGNNYEYFVQIRNQTGQPLKWELTFANFPREITLFSPRLTGGTLGAYASETIKFGKGTNGNINTGTVAVLYDVASGTRPYVLMSKCV